MTITLSKTFRYSASWLVLGALLALGASHERAAKPASVGVQTGRAGCKVDLDADTVGTTDASGKLILTDVEPGDHYIHVRCPDKPEAGYFISPAANAQARIDFPVDAPSGLAAKETSSVAEDKIQLRRLVQQAVQLRGQGQADEAVTALRQAMKLDPENADLHREMGITFLMAKEWKRARVEMIEAIRHDQGDADAHNGLGYALEKLDDIDGAVKEYRIATQLEPDDPSYRTHYFDMLAKIQARKDMKK